MEELVRVASADQAAAARAELRALEELFRRRVDPASKRRLAREIVRLRTALTNYRVRAEMRQVHDEDEGAG
jgi:hypothetical protein